MKPRSLLLAGLAAGLFAASLAVAPAASGRVDALQQLDEALVHYRSALAGGPASFADLAGDFRAIARTAPRDLADDADLVAADCLERAGQHGRAIAIWQRLENSRPAFATYCRYRLGGPDAIAGAAHAAGPFAPDLLVAAGRAETDPVQATKLLEQAYELAPRGPIAETALYLLATRSTEDGPRWALRYLDAFPAGRHAVAVAQVIDPASLSRHRRELLAGAMLDSGNYGIALKLLAKDLDPLALYRSGRAYWETGQRDKALEYLSRARSTDPQLGPRVSYTLAQMAMRDRNWSGAIAPLRAAATDPGEIGEDAFKALTRVYLELDDDSAAAAVDRQVIQAFPNSSAAHDAIWRSLWRAFGAGHMLAAHRWAARLESDHGLLGVAAEFWLGRLDQDAGETTSALRCYRLTEKRAFRDPASWYYGWRARMRANALTGRAPDPGFAVTDGPVRVRPFALGSLLPGADRRQLGIVARSAEARRWPRSLRTLAYLGLVSADRLPPGRARMLVAAADADYVDAIRWAEQANRTGAAYSPLAESPLGFWSDLEPAAHAEGLDPLFLAALVKQESFFDPQSRSWVGAIGLAQLMPFTANWVGRQLGGTGSLYDPAWNLRCGAWYLAYTGRQFDHQGVLEAAAYNAGVAAVKRWQQNYGNDPESFIERIPFFETRHYVKKVYGYYWTYRSLYRTSP